MGLFLKDIDIEIPLGIMVGITGVSGSGKSTLINETLYPILNSYIYKGVKKPLPYKSITGLTELDKVVDVNQSPIGRTPRSNPATYCGVFAEIRKLFTMTPETKMIEALSYIVMERLTGNKIDEAQEYIEPWKDWI